MTAERSTAQSKRRQGKTRCMKTMELEQAIKTVLEADDETLNEIDGLPGEAIEAVRTSA